MHRQNSDSDSVPTSKDFSTKVLNLVSLFFLFTRYLFPTHFPSTVNLSPAMTSTSTAVSPTSTVNPNDIIYFYNPSLALPWVYAAFFGIALIPHLYYLCFRKSYYVGAAVDFVALRKHLLIRSQPLFFRLIDDSLCHWNLGRAWRIYY